MRLTPERIVQHFLARQPGVKPADYANHRLAWYRKTYPTMFNFTQVSRSTVKWTAVEVEDVAALFAQTGLRL